MDFKKINKERRLITLLSITVTLLIVALYVIANILFARVFVLVPIIGLLVLLILLYLFSNFVIYKYYLNLKTKIINLALTSDSKAKSIINYNVDESFLYHFFDKKYCNIKAKLRFQYENKSIDTIEFEVVEKRNFKSDKVVSAGKYLTFKLNEDLANYSLILNNKEFTNIFVDYFKQVYKKQDDNVLAMNKKRYTCLYNDTVDLKVLNIFDKISGFNMISIHDGMIHVLFIDDTPIFDFKLQQNINSSTINKCNQCFNKLIKLINSIRKVF